MTPRLGAAAVALALGAALLLPDNRIGLAAAALGAGLVALAWAAGAARERWTAGLLALAGALALAPLLRDANWIVTLDLMAAATAATTAVSGAATWRAVGAGLAATAWRLVPAWPAIARATAGPVLAGRATGLVPVARGLALGAVVVAVFGALFVSADQAFAEIVDDTVVPHWDLGLLPARGLTFAAIGALAGALALSAGAARATGPPAPRGTLSRTEWALPLLLLDALFALFVAVQLTVLFGGHDHVLDTTGLTYAEYAREGFGELVVVAALVLGVIALAARHAAVATPGERRLMQVLLGVLCALTFVVLASALRRLGLYEEAFGFTRARLMAHTTILWLGAVFGMVIAAGVLRRGAWLPRGVVALTAATLLGLTLSNPDARIAAHNAERFEASGKLDRDYAASLSADAIPTLTRLPGDVAGCVLDAQRDRLADADGWPELNLGRERARSALRAADAVCR